MGLVANLLAMLGGLIGTGIFYAVTKERSQFVRHHAAEALNFTITLTIVSFALPLGVMPLLLGGTFVFDLPVRQGAARPGDHRARLNALQNGTHPAERLGESTNV